MLKEFRLSNYRSIKNEQIFTMEACSPREVSEYPDHVIQIGDQRILKVSSLYGPNGSGKTNLLNGILLMTNIVKGSLFRNDARGNDNYMPCLLNDKSNPYTKFEIFVVRGNMEIGYSLLVDLRKLLLSPVPPGLFVKCINVEIINEELIYRKFGEEEFKTLFTRDENGIVASDLLQNIDLIKSKRLLLKNTTFVNYVFTTFGQTASENLTSIIEFGKEISSIVVLSKESGSFIFSKEQTLSFEPYLEKTKQLLNGLDLSIDKIYFKEVESGIYCLFLERVTKSGERFAIQINSESKGTRKIVNIIFDVLSAKSSGIFIADDFDSHLHPKLIRTIVELFTSKENTNKQLLFNSHDITNMNNQVFRRDEIWFAQRDSDTYSTVYFPLSNIVDYKGNMVRKDAVYGKQYLEGKYGSDPFIKKGLEWSK